MNKNISKIIQLFQIDFSDSASKSYTSEDIRRIKMVNTISLIGIMNLVLYGVIYCFIDHVKFFIPIVFYFAFAFLTLGIIFVNKLKYFTLAKILVTVISPFYLTINSMLLFGKGASSHVYILLFSLIPLFVWSFKERRYILFFVSIDLLIYSFIEFFPPLIDPIFGLPSAHVEHFRSMNVFVAFVMVFIAVIYFQKFSNQVEQKLVQKTLELEKSQEHRDLVYSIIAHDLRSPFNGLMGLSDMLIKQYDELEDEKVKKYLSALNNAATSLNNLLINLLDWSKMQSGKLKLNYESFKIKQVIDEIVNLHSDLIQHKGIKLSNTINENLVVFADLYMISTVIRNLLTNAIKFTPKSGTIEFSAKQEGEFVEICICDSGIGIPQIKVSELLFVSNNYNALGTNNEKGSGLGLKICSDFVLANGGKIWVESEEGSGSCFYFTLKAQN